MNAVATLSPHSRRALRATTAATGLAVAATLGATLLLELSRFGTHPYAVLPLPVLLLFGTLFSGALVDVLAPLDALIFTLLAFAGQGFATPSWLARVIASDVAVKYASSLFAAVGLNTPPSALARRARGGPDPETT
jgi:hypothetical protein